MRRGMRGNSIEMFMCRFSFEYNNKTLIERWIKYVFKYEIAHRFCLTYESLSNTSITRRQNRRITERVISK